MTEKDFRDSLTAKFKLARSKMSGFVNPDQRDEWTYWRGYYEAVRDLMSEDVLSAIKAS